MSLPQKKLAYFTSDFPSCTVLMRRTNVEGYKLRFPTRFCRHINFKKHGSMVFEIQNERKWKMNYFDEGVEGSPRIVVAGGWMYFVKDNFLKFGDTCGFEWLPHRKCTTIRVTIFRNSRLNDSGVRKAKVRAPTSTSGATKEKKKVQFKPMGLRNPHFDGGTTCPPRPNVASYVRTEKKKLLFKPKTSRFFKIIFQECVDRGTLGIPKKFESKHINDLPNQILLKVPSGAVWKVELVKDDGLWLKKGWRAFQEYYSIAHGTFLLFEYKGGSSFDVTIFDRTTSEIDYPYDDDYEEPVIWREHKEASKKRKRDDNAGVGIHDECLPSSKNRKKSPLLYRQPPKMERATFSSNPLNKSKLNTSSPAKRDIAGVSKHGENRISKNAEVLRDTRTSKTLELAVVNTLNKSTGCKEASCSKSEIPSFAVVMKPTYVSGYYVLIPFSFARTHLKQEVGNVYLQISKNKAWKVAYKTYSRHRVAQFKSGWSTFVGHNKLQTGDTCVFELINPAERILKVVIVRANNEKVAWLPAPKKKYPSPKTKTTVKLERSGPELQTHVPPVVAQSIRVKTEIST